MEDKEILIPGEKVGRPPAESKLQKLIVLGITAVGNAGSNLDKVGIAQERGEEHEPIGFGKVAIELWRA